MSKTVFILGAGASKEVGLPIGSELKHAISKCLDLRFENGHRLMSGEPMLVDSLRHLAETSVPPSRDINPYLRACWTIRDGMPLAPSIDNFIDVHAGNKSVEICGKLGIVHCVLSAERQSMLRFERSRADSTIDFLKTERTWFSSAFQLITENCIVDGLKERLSGLGFVIFNYDRCFEHYFLLALQTYYQITDAQARELFACVEIYHPYGVVGNYSDWGKSQGIEYGGIPDARRLLDMAKQIRTFTEGTDSTSSDIVNIRKLMKEAHRLVFLGFAFHPLNMSLLMPAPPETGERAKHIYGTGLGLSRSDATIVETDLMNRFAPVYSTQIDTKARCFELFEQYRRSLSFV